MKVFVNILFTASYINTESPNLTHSSLSLRFFPFPFLQAHWRHDCHPVCSGMTLCDLFICCIWLVNVNNYLCGLDLPIPPPPFFFFPSFSLSPASWFSSHAVHTPPPGVGQPTNRKKQLHHPRQCHNTHQQVSILLSDPPPSPDFRLSRLPAQFALLFADVSLSLSLSPTGETFAILINQFMIIRQCSRKFNICIVWRHSSSLCPWLCSQTIEPVNNTKIISLCNAADRRSSAWQALSATSVW